MSKLPAHITHGIVNIPGRDPRTQAVAESLLEQDRQSHHCFFNAQGYHNHLSHHLLAAYDLGASAALLQAIYDKERLILRPIDGEKDTLDQVKITPENFAKYLGQERYYHAFLTFFTEQVKEFGASETIETYLFSPTVNTEGIHMLARFFGGLFHPFIQTGYGAEFGSDAIIAQGLAQAAMHSALLSVLLDLTIPGAAEDAPPNMFVRDERERGKPVFHILRELYDSDTLKPAPYRPGRRTAECLAETMKDGRPEEIGRLCATWWSNVSAESRVSDLDAKVEELIWATTLLLCGTGRRGLKPRLDFAFVHVLDATLFLQSLLKIIPSDASKVKLLTAFLAVTTMYVVSRGRPRIDVGLIMSYPAVPRPLGQPRATLTPSTHAIGDPNEMSNPWMTICSSVIHAPDAHTVKAIRVLYHAARHYGHKKARDFPWCFITADKEQREETLPGMSELDGTLFVRAACLVMDTIGWVTHRDDAGGWDFSGLGWDDAWK